jgi:hypothetical protein
MEEGEYEDEEQPYEDEHVPFDEHDHHTQAVLDVEFPPWYYSTHGLSRPASPFPVNKER